MAFGLTGRRVTTTQFVHGFDDIGFAEAR